MIILIGIIIWLVDRRRINVISIIIAGIAAAIGLLMVFSSIVLA